MTINEFKTKLTQIDFNHELIDDITERLIAANNYFEVFLLSQQDSEFKKLFNKFNPTLIIQ